MSEFLIRTGENMHATVEMDEGVTLTAFLEHISQLKWIVINDRIAIQVDQIKSVEKMI